MPDATKPSFFDKLTNIVHLDYVLKFGGIIMFALAMFRAWQHLPTADRFLMISGPIAWYVGDKFNKIYK